MIRKICENDVQDRFKIGKQEQYVLMCGGEISTNIRYPGLDYWLAWYETFKAKKDAWIIEDEGMCIGEIRLDNISLTDKNARLAIGIYDENKYGKGIGSTVVKYVVHFGFTNLDLHRIELRVLEYNERAIACYKKCGFNIEGILIDNALINGQYHNDIIMAIINN
ncbi:GNAT family N-acetyltransferase [Listeria ivanovii]|uniref:GNAT family N-acetyltransferase n=1 Tax=Listeria ivanovii TaxID=1638 RepID=UPI000DAA34B7|nr:GNAT family protein [Listeria ivanovii]PZG35935.1 GNAT family N-acetyltransferase [Listeria ivanovii]PZG49171.1 GNAT family N-acetyltransferase [Listeria ivanovii]PZH13892.1 GNAT family N-acetyltransferase [Listeria ivanovii]